MSDPRRSEGRSARLRSEWIVLQGSYQLRKGRGECDERRGCAREAKHFNAQVAMVPQSMAGPHGFVSGGQQSCMSSVIDTSSVTDMSAQSPQRAQGLPVRL